ncbi:MAG: porin [Isosphaeraceae bacterium]
MATALPSESNREAALEKRLRQMEEENRKLGKALESTLKQYGNQMDKLQKEISDLKSKVNEAKDLTKQNSDSKGDGSGAGRGGGSGSRGPGSGTGSAGGAASDRSGAPGYMTSGTRGQKTTPIKARFGNGFELITEDDEFQLQIHQETQTDLRIFEPNGDYTYFDNLVFPRVRLFLNGRVTKQWEYMFSINRGFGALDILDAWVNYHPSDAFQIKVGRFMTPFNYEQFAIQNMWLIAPERSLFTSNLGLNRMLGAQVWGQALNKRLDYAAGVYDGPRNSHEDFNSAKDIMAYLNARPFEQGESILKYLNFGGSFAYGAQRNPLVPRAWRTATNASNAGTADTVAPPFYIFNSTVIERGVRSFWSAHVAYFHRSLSLLADYNSGILRYAPKASALESVTIPVTGYSIALGYFLTHEQLDRRTIIDPIRPFNLKHGEFGLGAIEVIGRFHTIDFDPDMLASSLTTPGLWTNRVWATNVGINWYLTKYIKAIFDWQHNEYAAPVLYGQPDLRSVTNNLFWMRLQLYF